MSLECRRGRVTPTTAASPEPHRGVAWRTTTSAAVLTKARLAALREANDLPDPGDLLLVRLRPGAAADWTLTLRVRYASRPPAAHTFPFTVDPARLDADGSFEALFAFAAGAGAAAEPGLPYVTIIDVTEGAGHAPSVEVEGLGASPIPLTLEGDPPEEQPEVLACVRFPGLAFDFDRSFLRPAAAEALKEVDAALAAHPTGKLLILGHTDRVGAEQYNKDLADRRARATYAFITNDAGAWEELYQQEGWGLEASQTILADLGHDPGKIDGVMGPKTQAAMRAFLGVTGDVPHDAAFRERLFLAYMTGKHDVQATPDRFVSRRFAGCGELNPLVPESAAEAANAAPGNEANRRVVVYLLRDPPPEVPCTLHDLAPCHAQAATPGEVYRCAFYDRLAAGCPCEAEAEPPPPPANTLGFFGLPVGLIPAPPTFKLRVKLRDGFDKKNHLLRHLDVYVDKLAAQDPFDHEFSITLSAPFVSELVISLPDPREEGLPPATTLAPILDIKQKLDFGPSVDGWTVLSKLHPRLKLTKRSHGKATLELDPAFLPVTARCARVNADYRKLRSMLDGKKKGSTHVVEDPRPEKTSPRTYLLCSATADLPATSVVDVLVFFQNEMAAATDCDHYDFWNPTRTLTTPLHQGRYESASGLEFQEYPPCGWQDQLVAAAPKHLLLVFPTVFGPPSAHPRPSFGDMGYASVGVERIETLVKTLWADRHFPKGTAPELGKLIVAGWSSGMNTANQWFRATGSRVDGFFCFDAVGALPPKTPDGKGGISVLSERPDDNGGPKQIPTAKDWKKWLEARPGRAFALLSGGYSLAKANEAVAELRAVHYTSDEAKAKLEKALLLHSPTRNDAWYEDPDYKAAHLSPKHDFPDLPAPPAKPEDDRVYVVKKGFVPKVGYQLTLCHGSRPQPAFWKVIPGLAVHEAGNFSRLGSCTYDEFVAACQRLIDTGDKYEKQRWSKMRHTWSMSGGMRQKTGDPELTGYLRLVLQAAKDKKFLE